MNTKLISFMLVLGMIFSGLVITIPEQTSATWSGLNYYWDDEGGSDNLASTAANWYQMNGEVKTDNVVPTSSSNVFINESSSAVTWDLTIYIENLTISTGYTGTFTVSSHMNLGSLYVIAGVFSGGTTYYIDVYGNCYLNPTTLTNGQTKLKFTGDGTTLFVKNNRFLEARYYGNATITGAGFSQNLFVDNSTTLYIVNNARLAYTAYTSTSYCLIYGDLISIGNGHFRYFYYSSVNQEIPEIYQPQCYINIESTASGTYYLYQSGNIVGLSISISASTANAYLTYFTNDYSLSSLSGAFSVNVRTTLYLNDSKVYCGGSFLTSSGTVDYGTSSIVCYGGKSTYTISPSTGASLYNLTINNTGKYQLGSSFTVTSWVDLQGELSLNGYVLTAPPCVYNTYLPTSVNEGEYYYSDIHTNVSFSSTLATNATWLDEYLLLNNTKTITGIPGPGDSGTYYVEYTVYNIMSSQTFYWNITVYDAIYCYISSIPDTTLTVGDMYNYHPTVVCNGTYYFGINNNGALIVSNGTGNVTGSPIAGIYDIEMYVTDSSGNIAYQNWTLTVKPFVSEWSNDEIVDIALLVIIMGIITLFNYLGYVKNSFLLQILSFIVFIFVLVPLWPGSEIGGLLVLVFGIGNIGLLIGGLMK